jgi:diazepam-binding inhibitor (GABA receptor modulator, acyl-CoA-binding protein)
MGEELNRLAKDRKFRLNIRSLTAQEKRMADLKQQFEAAAKAVMKLDDVDNSNKLRLYGLFKQGTDGDVEGKRPGFTDMVGRAKYDAWAALKGTAAAAAMQQYVDLVKKLQG